MIANSPANNEITEATSYEKQYSLVMDINNLLVLRKTSLVDYPGKVAAALFFRGCNLRCPWCQNRELALTSNTPNKAFISPDQALRHIEKRRAVLGGVVLSGGEPTLYRGLPALITRIKALGLLVKLDTNGTTPYVLETLFSQRETTPDYIALDLKLAPARYTILGAKNPTAQLTESVALIHAAGVDHEFRSLALPYGFFTDNDIEALAPLVDDAPWFFRRFQPGNCLDPAWDEFPAAQEKDSALLARKASQLGKRVSA
ncbi:MAG: anaerobic ribonucleoside-triphosphate reductase activating protein [Treponema sp.]|jgi:pyruvate formate lyase activating enzyme|nr:anaerobic ribonucleoside-triphosphate reductase activating protein [Treponema sp.]